MGALLTTTGLFAVGAVAMPRSVAAQAQSARAYDIPAGGLTAALNRFADASQIQLVYDASITRSLNSPGVTGTFTPAEALARILAGSRLDWRFANARTVTISAPVAGNTQAGFTAEDGTIQLDTIVVTGEKLTRDLSDVYTSVGLITGDQIEDFAIKDVDEGLNRLANTRVTNGSRGNSGIVIRGTSSEGFSPGINQTNAVAVIIDGAAQNQEGIRRGSRGTWDVSSLEVLRGPQSTLQGNSAMAGAVIVNTNDPSWDWTGAVMGDFSTATGYGHGDVKDGAFMLSGPLVENQLAFRVSGQIIDGDKGIEFADPRNKVLGEDEFEQIRAKMLFTPEALNGFTALLSYSHTRDKPGAAAASGPDFFERRFASFQSNMEIRDTTVDAYVANLSKEIGDGIVLRSITSYLETDAKIDSIPGQTAYFRDALRAGTDFHQDLRVELAPDVRPLSGVAGLYYGNVRQDSDTFMVQTGFGTIQDLDVLGKTESFALYGDFRYKFQDRWALLFGGRLGVDTVKNSFSGTSYTFPADLDEEEDFFVALPKIGLAYDLTENQTVAFTVSEGYRPGFSTVTPDGIGGQLFYAVDPEYLWSYELAYRSTWLDDRLAFNVTGFYYDFSDMQVEVPNPALGGLVPSTLNIGEAHAYGAEFEVRYRATDELTTFASLGLLKTHIDDGVVPVPFFTGDYTGNDFAESPAVTLNVGAVYKHHSGFFAAGDLTFTNSYYSSFSIDNDPEEEVPSFGLVNVSVGYEGEHASITLYAKNLFDEEYVTGLANNTAAPGADEAIVGDGRTIGIRAKATF
ncbi:TonB-dependent receptor domain-containing protein [Terrihabitans sp. B22-R8]|uniref:TonB-dependent receptor domain-containing protein n=1 Tax=Terrihabitans sp. B22-R8 TaxID=3425128 RepID=UPI00403C2AF6